MFFGCAPDTVYGTIKGRHMNGNNKQGYTVRLVLRKAVYDAEGRVTDYDWDDCEVAFTSRLRDAEVVGVARVPATCCPVTTGAISAEVLSRDADTLNLTTRAQTGLLHAGIRSIGDLVRCQPYELLKVKGIGETVLREYAQELELLGLYLGMPLK